MTYSPLLSQAGMLSDVPLPGPVTSPPLALRLASQEPNIEPAIIAMPAQPMHAPYASDPRQSRGRRHPEPDAQGRLSPNRLLAAEITREKIYDRLHQELPYKMAVVTEEFVQTHDRKSISIRQVVVIEDKRHKGIVLGRQGQTIKIIGSAARAELMDIFQCPVHLELFVQHRENWLDKDEAFLEYGYDNI